MKSLIQCHMAADFGPQALLPDGMCEVCGVCFHIVYLKNLFVTWKTVWFVT